jgi:Kef-type K+ transport system membrane component KefB
MYCSGAELRSILARRDSKATIGIAVLGNAVPFLAGLGFVKLYDTDRFLGPAGNRTAFVLVFALAMAVTSIPVISRIMTDLGIMGTRFARIVLSVAVLEDLSSTWCSTSPWPWWRPRTPTPSACPSCSGCSRPARWATPTTW